jgi:hypothetical protein
VDTAYIPITRVLVGDDQQGIAALLNQGLLGAYEVRIDKMLSMRRG